jgi:hypothetical protein
MLKVQLTLEQSKVIAMQKSAAGIVGNLLTTEGPNKLGKVITGAVLQECICKAIKLPEKKTILFS